MITEETIYTGNSLNEAVNNESDAKKVIAKVWKPVTIGGSAGIMLGTGAILMTSAQDELEAMDDFEAAADDIQEKVEAQIAELTEVETEAAETNNMTELLVATVDDKLPFSYAFASARDQVGPGGVFTWRSVIFSTYTSDEWNAMSEEEHEQFAQRVHPEVAANNVSKADLEDHIAMAPVDDVVVDDDFDDDIEDELLAENPDVETPDTDMDLAQAQDVVDDSVAEEIDIAQAVAEEIDIAQAVADDAAMAMIDKDIAAASAQSTLDPQADVEISAQDAVGDYEMAQLDDVMIADDADDMPIEDIALADVEDDAEDDFALSDMFDLKPADDLAMATPATKASDGVPFENFLSDNTVRIVGYGEFDGHQVRGLDLNGDDKADIAVIDIDDSGDLSSADMIVEQGNGNQFTYGELQEFAMNQDHGDDHHLPNPDIADDMPDYMDDAMAQL